MCSVGIPETRLDEYEEYKKAEELARLRADLEREILEREMKVKQAEEEWIRSKAEEEWIRRKAEEERMRRKAEQARIDFENRYIPPCPLCARRRRRLIICEVS